MLTTSIGAKTARERDAGDSRRGPYRAILILSVVLNLGAVGAVLTIVEGRGGFAYLKAFVRHDPAAIGDTGYAFRKGLFEISFITPAMRPIVFVGDSLTAEGNWPEFFECKVPVLNRGIGADTSVGVLRRLEQITTLSPTAVFLMIGTNDRQEIGMSPQGTAGVIREIIASIRRKSPNTLIFLQALLPTRAPKFVAWSQKTNELIAPLADQRSVFLLDFRQAFFENGVLAARLTRDGIHMSPAGYRLWKASLDPVIDRLNQTIELQIQEPNPATPFTLKQLQLPSHS